MALYKGLTVGVYAVDRREINLTRHDVVELINVCRLLFVYLFVCLLFIYSLVYLLTAKHGFGRSLFYSKTGFGPRTAKSQPIWIKFCTHLLLYAIHLWADLDRDRLVGDSRPNQNVFFVILNVMHPKSYIETTDRRDIGGKLSEWMSGRVLS